jgi:hypothetical protein
MNASDLLLVTRPSGIALGTTLNELKSSAAPTERRRLTKLVTRVVTNLREEDAEDDE